jgi:D-sedoheptulose 7-phosphate isomerase
MQNKVVSSLNETIQTLKVLSQKDSLTIVEIAELIVKAYRRGNKVVAFGNGGSAADAQHLVTELGCRFEKNRKPLQALALTTNSSMLTAIANDYDYKQVFSRQVLSSVKKGDIVIAISTSGNSSSVLEGAKAAKKCGGIVVSWTGRSGGRLKALSDISLCIPSDRTARIQEGHLSSLHAICLLVEDLLF